jgi:hypothetical protein
MTLKIASLKKAASLMLTSFSFICSSFTAQEISPSEKYGNTLNAGMGCGYFAYIGYATSVFHLDFEIALDKNLTIAPSLMIYSYQKSILWGDQDHLTRNYNYGETVLPMGIKVTYYFDQLLKAGLKWDFYSSGTLGFILRSTKWERGYKGQININPGTGPLYIDFHLGSEYHLTKVMGIYLDVSLNVATFGTSIHF